MYTVNKKLQKHLKKDWNIYFTSVKSTKNRKDILNRQKETLSHNRTWGGCYKNIYGFLTWERNLLKIKYEDLF